MMGRKVRLTMDRDNRLKAIPIFLAFLFGTVGLANTSCSQVIQDVFYSASFDLPESAQTAYKMKLLIGKPKSSSEMIAQIWSGKSCQAVCDLKMLQKEDAFTPISLEMDCKSPSISALATPATLYFHASEMVVTQPEQFPTLRFGTWLQGYHQSLLSVQVDRYTKPGRSPGLSKLAIAQ